MSTASAEFPFIEVAGERRYLACKQSKPGAAEQLPAWSADNDTFALADITAWLKKQPNQCFDMGAVVASPILDQDGCNGCFPPGTLVRMADGTERPIEQVRPLDRVLTAEGNIGLVTGTMVRPATALLNVKFWGHGHLRLTDEHPILTQRGYVKAGEITLDDWAVFPGYIPATTTFIQPAQHATINRWTVRKDQARRFAGPVGRTDLTVIVKALPDIIHLTVGAGRIFGFFLAEGSTSSRAVVWTFSKDERDTLAAELVSLLDSEWGVQAVLKSRPNNTTEVVVYGSTWASLFESLCSKGAGSKAIHPDLTSGPEDFLRAMFEAWVAGDGYSRRGTVSATSVSHSLALSMYDIAQGLGLCPTLRRADGRPGGGVVHRQPAWTVEYAVDRPESRESWRSKIEAGRVWRKVRGIEQLDYAGYVHNFSVEGDNSYVAEGVGVHNCSGWSATGCFNLTWNLQGNAAEQFSPGYQYSRVNGGRDAGGDPIDNMNSLLKNGICLQADNPNDSFYAGRIPAGAAQSAARFKLEAAYVTSSWLPMITALAVCRPVNFGMQLGRAYGTVDQRTGLVAEGGYLGLHAQFLRGLFFHPEINEVVAIVQNSWTGRWGVQQKLYNLPQDLHGCAFIRERDIFVSYFEAYAMVAAVPDPQDPRGIPIAKVRHPMRRVA